MDEETKEKNYAEGDVKISSKEYRDLIEEICNLKDELKNKQDECIHEWRRAYNAEQEIKSLKNKLKEMYNKSIRDFTNLKDDFMHYFIPLMPDEFDDEDN